MNAVIDIKLTEDEYNALKVICDIECEDIEVPCKNCPLNFSMDNRLCFRSQARHLKHLYDNRGKTT